MRKTLVAAIVAAATLGGLPARTQERLADFYDPEVVQIIGLQVSEQHLRDMQRALPERIFVPGTFEWNGLTVRDVAVRYKGNSSSNPLSPHKRGFLVKFSEFTKGQRFLGLRRVALDNGIQFGGLFSERLITDVLRGLGLAAPRSNYARVYLNGEYLGVYVNVERIDESFLDTWFSDDSGPLFKVHQGGPGADLRLAGTTADAYRQAFELDAGDESTAWHALVEFIRAINQPVSAEAGRGFRDVFKVEPFLKTMAVMLLAGAFDQYTGWGPHNYYLYRDPADGRWTYLPWDLDVGFADRAFGQVPVLEGWHAAWPVPVPGRPLLERVVSDPELLARYRQETARILESHFRPDVLIPKLRALHAQIRAVPERDPFPGRRVTNPTDTSDADVVGSMERFITRRYELARAQLANPGPRPAFRPQPGQNAQPVPGTSILDAPSELRVVSAAPGRVELAWKDNAQGEAAFIVQKSLAADGAVFQNAIGLPGENLTSAVDPDVRPGVTYRYRVYAVRLTPNGPSGTGVSNVVTVRIPGG